MPYFQLEGVLGTPKSQVKKLKINVIDVNTRHALEEGAHSLLANNSNMCKHPGLI
jgi:hypothetical protein